MKYNGKYEVSPSDIVDGAISWKSTGSGAYIITEYRGKKYFVKRYTMGPRIPSKSIPEPVYSEQMGIAKWLENKQAEMRKLFGKKKITTENDHIVVEEENFWDDNMFVTVTQLIPDENVGFDYTALDTDTFKKLCADMALLLEKTHDAGVTHGDLKEKNILIQKKGEDLIPYLIDFDSSYPSDYGTRKRADGSPMLAHPVVFSEGYQSPEIAIYNFEDSGVIDAATITEKTDIFTLALIYHRLWTGQFPTVIGDTCAVGEAVYLDEEIKIDSKFDIPLGPAFESKFSSLLMWMLSKDASARPTPRQIIDALSDKLDIDDVYETAESAARFDLTPHDIHKTALEIYKKETLKKKDVRAFAKITEGGMYKYSVKLKDGTELKLTVDEVIANGYGKAKKTTVGALWEEDAKVISFLPVDKLSEQGVSSIEAKQAGHKKFYFVALRAGGGYTTGRDGLVERGLASFIVGSVGRDEPDADKPWPEHGTDYDKEALKSRSVIKVEKVVEDEDKRYRLTLKTGSGKKQNVVKVNYMKIMKFIV